MYKALYRAYRPEVFSQVLGQEHIVRILKNQLRTGQVDHAYLFCGTRGTGKTTVARILAKGVNCTGGEEQVPCGKCPNCLAVKEGNFMDLIEIDGASNNGVENIREIRESVNYPPAVGRKKVYIIDEVHMLSTGAFNALLKTLEEPPENVMFILATTEPQKLPNTIISRCIRMDFRRVSEKVIGKAMMDIMAERGVEATDEAVRLMAMQADGSVRDGLTVLDRVMSSAEGKIDEETVLSCLGIVGGEGYLALTEAVISHAPDKAITAVAKFMEEGKDSRGILQGWMAHYRDLMMVKLGVDVNMSAENTARLRKQSEKLTLEDINRGVMDISRAAYEAASSTVPGVILEICAIKMTSDMEAPPAAATVDRDEDKDKRHKDAGHDRGYRNGGRTEGYRNGSHAEDHGEEAGMHVPEEPEDYHMPRITRPPEKEHSVPTDPEDFNAGSIAEGLAALRREEEKKEKEQGDRDEKKDDRSPACVDDGEGPEGRGKPDAEVQKVWDRVFDRIVDMNPMFMGMAGDIQPVSFDGRELVLGVSENAGMFKEMLEEQLTEITGIFRDVTGADGRVRLGDDIKAATDTAQDEAAVRAFEMIAGTDAELEIK